MKKLFFILFAFTIILGCEKEDPIEKKTRNYKVDELQIAFAKILAPAINESSELRNLVKSEALKKFNNDYDVLYQSLKNKVINGVTVSEFLLKYANSEEQFKAIEKELPLLTIFVPTVPNFNPEGWDCTNEIPKVAVQQLKSAEVSIYDASGNESVIEEGLIPGFPIIVVKQNERIQIGHSNNKSTRAINEGDFSYSFIDEAFDGSKQENQQKRITFSSGIDNVNIQAFNYKMGWHRDHVYYGLTPSKTIGNYRNNYSEFITSFKMLSSSWYGKIADQTGDPHFLPRRDLNMPIWFDGFFEFKVEVLINATNGAGTTLTKYFPAKGSDLADVTYKRYGLFWKVDKVTTKSYNPNLELIPWDLKNYGMAWKFIISEVDPSEEYTYSEEISSSFATNFEISNGTKTKIGWKFGASATTTSKSTCTRKISLGSDNLGEAILTFDQPIIVSEQTIGNWKIYTTREISTGWCSLSVEPKKIY